MDFVEGGGAKTVDVSPFSEGGESFLPSFLVLDIAVRLIAESKKREWTYSFLVFVWSYLCGRHETHIGLGIRGLHFDKLMYPAVLALNGTNLSALFTLISRAAAVIGFGSTPLVRLARALEKIMGPTSRIGIEGE